MVLGAACNQPATSVVTIVPSLAFPDVASDGLTVPLDAVDGFPVRVRVCAQIFPGSPPVGNTLQGHVWLSKEIGGANVGTSMPSTDALTVTLEPADQVDAGADAMSTPAEKPTCPGTGYYSAITTLNAPGPGPVLVRGDVDGQPIPEECVVVAPALGSIPSCTAPSMSPPPLITVSNPIPLAIWNGSVPRYSICAETAASKGTVTLTSPDPGLVSAMQTPLSGTLIPGPCSPGLMGGPSHVSFDLTLAPPAMSPVPSFQFTVIATLTGMPVLENNAEDPYSWTATKTIGADPPLVMLSVMRATPTNDVISTGRVCEVVVQATQSLGSTSTQPVEGLTVNFGSSTSGATFSPSSNITDSSGTSHSFVVVPFGTQIAALISGGGNQREALVPQDPSTNGPISLTSSVGAIPLILASGALFSVTAMASVGRTAQSMSVDGGTAQSTPVEGVSVTFGSLTGGTFSPANVPTDGTGSATSNVVVPYGTTTEVIISGGGAVTVPVAITGPSVTLTPTFSPTTIASPGPGLYTLTVKATVGTSSVPVPGLSITAGLTSIQGAGSQPSIAAPSPLVTDAAGKAQYTFSVASTTTSVTATVAGGNSTQSATLPE
jgi:hypothetical protein